MHINQQLTIPGHRSLTGGSGNDTIVLTETTAVTDRVVFEATATANGFDTITGFQTAALAAGGDVLSFAAFVAANGGAAGTLTAIIAVNPGATSPRAANTVGLLVDIADGQDISTAAGLLSALNVGGEYANVDAPVDAAVESSFYLTATSATATTFNVFYATSLATSLEYSTVSLIGTVTTSGAFNTLVIANFIVA